MTSFVIRSVAVCFSMVIGFGTGVVTAAETPQKLNLGNLPVANASLVKMRAVTRGPKFHWFGYYDKDQIDATGRYLLAMEVDFEHRSPRPDDVIKIGMVDLADGNRWIELAESRAWSWQQGCMLQWRPGSETEILFNDRQGNRFVCRVFNVKTGKVRTLPMAIEHVTADGKWAVCSDYRRIQYIRAGYGYAGLPDPNRDVLAPDDVGAWLMDLETGDTKLLVSVAQLAKIPYPKATPKDKHYASHFAWSPDGKRFLMFNRWVVGPRGRGTRVFTSNADGSDLRLLSARGASHWTWRDPEHVLFWSRGGYKIYKDDGSGKPKETLWLATNGHQSYVPGTDNQWLVTDTYASQSRKREQILYLFHLPTGRVVVLGEFRSPKEYTGEWRCDLHPRVSRDGKWVIIDSPHGGNGRQQYLFDISRVIAGKGSSAKAESRVPRNFEELQTRLGELRREYAPYLRSLPNPLEVRSRTPLDSGWRTKYEVRKSKDGNRPDPPDWYREDLDDSDWEPTTVPEWRYEAERWRHPLSCIFWYRTRFTAPEKGTGPIYAKHPTGRSGKLDLPPFPQRTFLVFGGVDWEAEVWLNGKKLGSHAVYYEPFRFDVTDLLKKDNTLAVRVIDGPRFGEPRSNESLLPLAPAKRQRYVRDRAQSIPGFQKNDLIIGSGYGIHREVYLETTGEACVAGIFARGNPEEQSATIIVELDAAAKKRLNIEVQILPENFEGRAYRFTPWDVPKGTSAKTVTVPMPEAKLWTPKTPRLYRCRVICRAGGARSTAPAIVDARDVLFGCRSFDIVSRERPRRGLPEGMFLLNGKPVYLRGTNIQGENALWYWGENNRLLEVLLMIKAADFNAIRSCQHVCYPEIRELLDRLGIMSEQDQGSGNRSRNWRHLPRTGRALARVCYNNPGVVLLSFGNETKFDPTEILRAVWAVDPQRIVIPISGNGHPKKFVGYSIPDAWWANVVDDFHQYPGWYSKRTRGALWILSVIRKPARRLTTAGEYGAEALDGYETMAKHYPAHWKKTPPPETDTLWGHVQVEKAGKRQFVGFRGKRPTNLGQYIEASQNYQADVLAEVTKGLRLSPRTISGYFQFHFIDILPASWPKSIVSHDLIPKKGYYAMAQVNQPLVPLFQMLGRGEAMELWVANDLLEPFSGCRLQWNVEAGGKTLLSGEKLVDVPAVNAASAARVDLSPIPPSVDLVTIRLKLSDADGKTLATYEQEVFLRAWREQRQLLKTAKVN